MRTSWTRFLAAAAALLAWLQGPAGAGEAAAGRGGRRDRPNIIFILADDIGIDGFGCYGGKFPTPRIDDLARSGVRFERGFSAPLCGPSRAQCLTGRYGFRTGVVSNETGGKARPECAERTADSIEPTATCGGEQIDRPSRPDTAAACAETG